MKRNPTTDSAPTIDRPDLPGIRLLSPGERAVYTRYAVSHLNSGVGTGRPSGKREAIAAELGISIGSVSVLFTAACHRIRNNGPQSERLTAESVTAKIKKAKRLDRAFSGRHCQRCGLRGKHVCLPAVAHELVRSRPGSFVLPPAGESWR